MLVATGQRPWEGDSGGALTVSEPAASRALTVASWPSLAAYMSAFQPI
jgi:hypothetical protein